MGASEREPLSAIDWLSESVANEPAGALPEDVTVEPLARLAAAVGTLSPDEAGLPADLWSGSREDALRARIEALPNELPPPLRDLVVRLMTVRAAPPGPGERLLLTRIDRLLAMGRLDAARALIDAAGPPTPQLFRRAFDLALLTGNEDAPCRTLETRPDIAPTYPARIFCLARGGDWPAAALTLETAEALDVLSRNDGVLMARFLDDGAEDFLPPPRRPDRITPLAFRIYEAIGAPMSSRTLPLAFAHADLRPQMGWKTRLEAGERLTRAGALPVEALVALYTERRPAASGGVWDRATAVQAVAAALESGEAGVATEVAGQARAVMEAAQLGFVLDALLLQPDDTSSASSERDLPEVPVPEKLAALLAEGRTGEAVLAAVARAADAWEGDADDLAGAVATLREAGLGAVADELGSAWTKERRQ